MNEEFFKDFKIIRRNYNKLIDKVQGELRLNNKKIKELEKRICQQQKIIDMLNKKIIK